MLTAQELTAGCADGHVLQVACFCGTVMAAQRVAAGALPLGWDMAESELQLQQTEEALEAGLR